MTVSLSHSCPQVLPASAIVPTRHRPGSLCRLLESLASQSAQPAEVLVIDASEDDRTERLCRQPVSGLASAVRYNRADQCGAAVQRNQGVACADRPVIIFVDDDVVFEPECFARLWAALAADPGLGGVSAMITNQRYSPPGRFTRALLTCLHGRSLSSFAGRCVGPAMNLLPEDAADLPDVVPVEWLNLGCSFYRREALPVPPFPPSFSGYSMLEDLTLSLRVAREWRLANVRTARLFHDSQPGSHKSDPAALAEMELVNRYYVMTQVLGRTSLLDHARLVLMQAFHVCASLRRPAGWGEFHAILRGKARGLLRLARQRSCP